MFGMKKAFFLHESSFQLMGMFFQIPLYHPFHGMARQERTHLWPELRAFHLSADSDPSEVPRPSLHPAGNPTAWPNQIHSV